MGACAAKPILRETPPFQRLQHIVIVGAGPAGLHLAYMLQKKGFQNVTILDSKKRVGGKCKTVVDDKGVPHEMGACWMHPGYQHVISLANELKQEILLNPGGQFGGRDVVVTEKSIPQPLDYVVKHGFTEKAPGLFKSFQLASRYLSIHKKFFGKYNFSVPPKPDATLLPQLGKPFKDFLKDNGLAELIPMLRLVHSGQGYGWIEDTPALYGLWWCSPPFVQALVNHEIHAADSYQHIFKFGYQNLWTQLVETAKLNVRLQTNVLRIIRHLGTSESIEIAVSSEGVEETIRCDFLVLACPFDGILSGLTDAQDEERELITNLRSILAVSTRITMPVNPQVKSGMCLWWERYTASNEGKCTSLRNSMRFSRPELVEKLENKEHHTFVALQYLTDYDRFKDKGADIQTMLVESCIDDVKKFMGSKEFTVQVEEQYMNKYFPHFSGELVAKGYPWKWMDIQARYKTWYIGASASFESVNDVINYNLMILERFGFD